ncbi:aspartyl protease family protein [Brevundimonas sp. R86498]|uniref:aspartyl protease family protein n=1 Tax=Brevundimonas sp. R86498 TaxID=3093845 RepID=UPI0037C6998F
MLRRRDLITAASALFLPGVAGAQDATVESSERLRGRRLSVPVFIAEHGPFAFALDSAANASVISDDLAARLGLPSAGPIGMHTLIARELVETVRAREVRSGNLRVPEARFAIARRSGLDGADGLIGRDLLMDHRLVLRFRGEALAAITRSRRPGRGMLDPAPQTALFRADAEERHRGLLMIDVRSGEASGKAIIDTGAAITIVNTAFARAAGASPITLDDGTRVAHVTSPTGLTVTAIPMRLRRLHFAGVTLRETPVLVGDFHTFDIWGLADRPAMLLGTDVLGQFQTVIIDLKRAELLLET